MHNLRFLDVFIKVFFSNGNLFHQSSMHAWSSMHELTRCTQHLWLKKTARTTHALPCDTHVFLTVAVLAARSFIIHPFDHIDDPSFSSQL